MATYIDLPLVFNAGAANLATSGPGGVTGTLPYANLPVAPITPGSYTSTNLTVNQEGIITSIANGSASGGNVNGPGSSTDNAIVRWNGTGGISIKDSPNTYLDDSIPLLGIGTVSPTASFHLVTQRNQATLIQQSTSSLGGNEIGIDVTSSNNNLTASGAALSIFGGRFTVDNNHNITTGPSDDAESSIGVKGDAQSGGILSVTTGSSTFTEFIQGCIANATDTKTVTGQKYTSLTIGVDIASKCEPSLNGSSGVFFANAYGIRSIVNNNPSLTSGTLVSNSYGTYLDVTGSPTGASTGYGLYVARVTGSISNWAIYSNTTAGSFLAGGLTINGTLNLASLIASRPLKLDGSNNVIASQITLSSTNDVTGTLGIGNGGTGQTTANAAVNALLPTQTGNNGKFLKTDGSNTSWATVIAGVSGPGSSTNTAFSRWNGTGGNTLEDSGVLCDGSNNVSGIGKLTILAGASTGIVDIGGTLDFAVSDAGNINTGETDLYTSSIPASCLGTNGDSIEFYATGIFSSNVGFNGKRFKAKFGATTLVDSGALMLGSANWSIWGTIMRATSSTQRASVEIQTNIGSLVSTINYTEPAENLTSPVTLKITGQGDATNDVVAKFWKVYWAPAH